MIPNLRIMAIQSLHTLWRARRPLGLPRRRDPCRARARFEVLARNSAGKALQGSELDVPPTPPGACPDGCSSNEPYETKLSQETIEQIAKYGEEAPAREQQRLAKEHEEQQAKEAATQQQHAEEQAAAVAMRQQEAEHPACCVPALKGDRLAAARRALAKAHCRLGAVHQPAHSHGTLRVSAQGAPAGEQLAGGARVMLWVGAKGSGAKQASRREEGRR